MNYFAHGRSFLDEPYFVAGTAVPDWLNVANRRAKTRSNRSQELVNDEDPQVAAIARGIVQHHHDDQWFHQSVAFVELNLQFSVRIRDCAPDDKGFRPHFLGHILVELLLDADLIQAEPTRLDQYYRTVSQVDSSKVQAVVELISGKSVSRMAEMIDKFCQVKFLYDYLEDEKLLMRLNQVMKRVGLPTIPPSFTSILPDCRIAVANRRHELLSP